MKRRQHRKHLSDLSYLYLRESIQRQKTVEAQLARKLEGIRGRGNYLFIYHPVSYSIVH